MMNDKSGLTSKLNNLDNKKSPNNINNINNKPINNSKSGNIGTVDPTHSSISHHSNVDSELPKENELLEEKKDNLNTKDTKTKKQLPQNNDDNNYVAKKNNKPGPGEKLDKDGNVTSTGTKKAVEAIGRGAAAYATGGASIGVDQKIAHSSIGNKTIGVVADTIDKVPIAGKVVDKIGDSGLADGVNNALDTVGKVKNKDIKGAAKSGKKTKKDAKKVASSALVKLGIGFLIFLIPIILVAVVISAICGPILGAATDIVNKFKEVGGEISDFFDGEAGINLFDTDADDFLHKDDNDTDDEWDNMDDEDEITEKSEEELNKDIQELISTIPGYQNLSELRQNILLHAATIVADDSYKYIWGGKPTSPLLIKDSVTSKDGIGVDCTGFVQWIYWSSIKAEPGSAMYQHFKNMGAQSITLKISPTKENPDNLPFYYIDISKDELRPGDIGLMCTGYCEGQHAGIYAGNGYWFHASSPKLGIIHSMPKKENNFKYFARFSEERIG